MSQIKIYGLETSLKDKKQSLSDIIHHCVVECLAFPQHKRFHRFIMLKKEDFYYPESKTDDYIIIEMMMMSGRTVDTKKKLINMLFKEINRGLKIAKTDIEISIFESPPSNWGFGGMTGDEITLNYKIEV